VNLLGYDRYKKSGVEWLGDLPEHWKTLPIRRCANRIQTGSTPPTTEDRYYEDGTVPWYGPGSFDDQIAVSNPVKLLNASAVVERAARIFAPGATMIVTIGATLGKVSSLAASGSCNQQITVIEFDQRLVAPRFATYQLKRLEFALRAIAPSATLPILDQSEIADIAIGLPPLSEQAVIAAYLDAVTGRLDLLREKKEGLIERLKEKRVALVSQAVTCGLPPAAARAVGFDPSPALKPSGVEWLGEVPIHWDIRKFSREVEIAGGQVDPEREPFSSMLLIGPEHVQSGTGHLIQRSSAAEQAAESGKYLCRKGDVVYSKIRPALRKLVIAPEDCLCSADMYPLRGRRRVDNSFIYWLFLSQQFAAWSVLEADRVAMPKINRDTLNELRMPVPPLLEQRAIGAYLNVETAKLDSLVSKVEEAIERLLEYRTALVNAAVTGKVDVRKATT
jgi:type I restriction enzyme, S subunit